MANFAVAASPETIERANKVMEMYAQSGDKKEDILLRILDLAESESIKGTHPELEDSLKAVDSTISTLIKQINGIVAGQDIQLTELKEKLNTAIEEKRTALELSKKQLEEAQSKVNTAESIMKQAALDIEAANEKAQKDIQAVEKEANNFIEKANTERDQAIRERDDARIIAAEKTASNDLLMRQMTVMEQEIAASKELREKYNQLLSDYSSLSEKAKEDARIAADKLKDTVRDAMDERKASEANLQAKITEMEQRLSDQKKTAETDLKQAQAQAELAQERAVMAKERELNNQLRQADKENAKLAAEIEQLKFQIKQLKNSRKNTDCN